MSGKEITALVIGTILLIVFVIVLGAFLLMWAWNVFMPEMFGLAEIDFVKGLALSIMLGSIGRVQINSGGNK